MVNVLSNLVRTAVTFARRGRPVAGGLLVLILAGLSGAQEDIAIEVDEAAAEAVAQPVFADENFDQWLFNNNRNADGARTQFNSQLKLQIEGIGAICGITPVQKQKLLLAGRGDIVRFFEKVEESRKKFQTLKNDQNKINEIFNDIRPLQTRMAMGLFGQGSLFDKTLRTTLNSDQARDWGVAENSRRQFQYRAKIELIISMLDDVAVFDDRQRRELLTFILENTKPPRQTGQYDYYVVMYQLTKVPEEKFKEMLRPPQLRALNRQLNQVRGIEQFLQQQGLLEIDADAGKAVDDKAGNEKASDDKAGDGEAGAAAAAATTRAE